VEASVLASKGDPLPITEGHKLFPPLTFIHFRETRLLRSVNVPVINMDHKFAAWLLERAPEIIKRYPGLFERIRSDLRQNWHWYPDSRDALNRLNASLDRLRELHPSVRPPKNLVLTEADILE